MAIDQHIVFWAGAYLIVSISVQVIVMSVLIYLTFDKKRD